MKFGYTIIYVPDVAASLSFFEQAFGFVRRFLHESQTYGELETGQTTLSFAAHELAGTNFPGGQALGTGRVLRAVPGRHAGGALHARARVSLGAAAHGPAGRQARRHRLRLSV